MAGRKNISSRVTAINFRQPLAGGLRKALSAKYGCVVLDSHVKTCVDENHSRSRADRGFRSPPAGDCLHLHNKVFSQSNSID
ncbi:MAG: hypothetical protein FWC97_10535 [Treponema sp.]|nr:hypothetical protein [Treponema sp.]